MITTSLKATILRLTIAMTFVVTIGGSALAQGRFAWVDSPGRSPVPGFRRHRAGHHRLPGRERDGDRHGDRFCRETHRRRL